MRRKCLGAMACEQHQAGRSGLLSEKGWKKAGPSEV